MAKYGEGDPRWIVQERKDGANVNSWHWEERDLSTDTQDDLKRRFKEYALCKEGGLDLRIKELSEISGDVTVAQRKGKMMCYFELKFTLQWDGHADGSAVSGKLTVPEVDHDNFHDDYEITVSAKDNDAPSQRAEAYIREGGRAAVRTVVAKYFEELFETYQIGKNLKSGASLPPPPSRPAQQEGQQQQQSDSQGKKGSTTTSGSQTSFSWRMRWRVPQEELFAVLMNEQRVSLYTRSQAKIDPRSGGTFEYLGGAISGYFVEVVPNERIKMQWRLRSWPTGIHSSVVMSLAKEEPVVSLLEFAQVGIPEGELQGVQEGWRANFFDAIKVVFGYTVEYI